MALGNVGDSRAYVINQYGIRQLTVDHTYVQELVERGQIKPEEALSHPQAHILTRAIGSEPGLKSDVDRYWIWPSNNQSEHEVLLLCTDGLYSHVSDEEIALCIQNNNPQSACVELVDLAKQRGGYDNITIAVIPLGGILKDEPPLGLQDKVQKGLSALKTKKESADKKSYFKTLLIILTLSGLFSLLAVLIVAFSLRA
jgi:serine/threonine protein phosphatase PrpC